MLSALSLPGESSSASVRSQGAAMGVARRWEFQQVASTDGLLVAADADLTNLALLRSEVRSSGASGVQSVADVLVALYRLHGDAFVEKLEGGFSIVLWDSAKRRLLLALDRMGIKSLYWRLENGRMLFASRVGAIRAVQDGAAEANRAAILQFLLFSVVPAPLSVYVGTHRLEPGRLLIFENGRVVHKQYWDIDYVEDSEIGESACAEGVRDAIRSSVLRTAAGCSPESTGAFLSGGTDSSSVVAFLTEWSAPVNSFTIFFGEGQYNEIEYARTTAHHFKTRHFEQCLTPNDAFDVVNLLTRYYDEPFANSSAIGGYYCARLARENGIDVLFAGDGGDELFGGNERYATDKRFSLYGSIPRFVRSALIEPLASILPSSAGPFSLPRKYIRRANISNPRRIHSYGLFLSEPPEEIFEPGFLEEVRPDSWMAIAQSHFDKDSSRSELNRLLYMDLKMTLSDNDLRKVLGTAEMAGVCVRFPFLDRPLVELSARIPTRWKVKGFEKRYIFKKALQNTLPSKVLRKKKHGFGVPVSLWLLRDKRLKSLMQDIMSDAKTRQRGIFQPKFLDQVMSRHFSEDAKNFGELIWYFLMLELWFRNHFERKADTVCADR
jgi:asparagine synthase (glutamine-hydrolysing)